MDKTRITIILILTCLMIIGTTCLAATGVVNAPSGLVLRETASKTANPLTTVPDDAKIEIIEKVGEWYKVKYENYEGYLFAEYVNEQEETKDEPKEEISEQNVEQTTEEQKVSNNATGVYPENIKVEKEIKAYILPCITSRVLTNIEVEKTITLNYELNNWINITFEEKEYWIRKNNIKVEEETESKEEKAEQQEETQKEDKETENKEQAVNETTENKKGYINVSSAANVRESASTSADVITTLLRNTEVTITGEDGDFYKIQYQDINGYISKSLVSDNPIEATSRGSSQERTLVAEETNIVEEIKPQENTNNVAQVQEEVEEEVEEEEEQEEEEQEETREQEEEEEQEENTNTSENTNSEGERIAQFAKQYVGYKYVYGGSSPSTGFDCSGFAQYVYKSCGYSIGRTCSNQLGNGTAVSRSELEAGDLIFFNNTSNGSVGHVGIYIGDGNIVHAANSRRGVVTETINSGYYNTYYYTARRIAN